MARLAVGEGGGGRDLFTILPILIPSSVRRSR